MLLCSMEEGKVELHETHKLDRIKRAHAQRGVGQNSGGTGIEQSRYKPEATACRFFQRGLCHHSKDHETAGISINTSVLHALSWVKKTGTWLKIVGHPPGLHKTNRALPQGSAKCYDNCK